jgi:hypothetical protein
MRFIWMAPQGVAADELQSSAEPLVQHAVTDLRDLMKILPWPAHHSVR